ncbi:MAG TPA: prepilin-type N-terminal cleavage/methylation domain-containing protein [Longimicrobiales bacterium]|nr:prepilin-type N-terminal cleavage/methylation domain-containing protein [Longimicrobiales bacterium]
MRNREGFTLLELMIVTVLIGILSTIMLATYSGLRERGMTAVTRSELRNLMTAIEWYHSVEGMLPETLDQLVDRGYHQKSPNINYCEFAREAGPPADLRVVATHRGSNLHLVAQYPSWGTVTEEAIGADDCS